MTDAFPDPDVLAQAIARIAHRDYELWAAQLESANRCARPVRLTGGVTVADPTTGSVVHGFDTDDQPDGVLLKACRARRATICPACASLYRADVRHLITAGLADLHPDVPVLFVTLTAPSFGPVHVARTPPGPCQPTDPGLFPQCHQPCRQQHDPTDPIVGTPICERGYDWYAAIMFNNRATELWRRTLIAAHRTLARQLAIPVRTITNRHRIAYAKIIEYQTRGAIHYHALLRCDPAADMPPAPVEAFTAAIHTAIASTETPNPLHPDRPIRWGTQVDITAIDPERRAAAAGYLTKYVTKGVDTTGALDHRLRHRPTTRPLPPHLLRLAQACWDLADHPNLARLNLRAWAHTLGYRGHWLTKSRTWSTTLGHIRERRHQWQLAQHGHIPDPDHAVIAEWTYQHTGHASAGDAWLARIADDNHQRNRRTAWEES